MTLRERHPAVMNALRALALWSAVTGSACALAAGVMLAAMQAGGALAAYAASTLALLAMALVPAALVRSFGQHATVPVASALVLTMAAMSAAAAWARTGTAAGAAPLVLCGVALLAALWWRSRRSRRVATPRPAHTHTVARTGARLAAPAWRSGAVLLAPALLAGLSSGMLARFQFFALCGASAASVTQVAISLAVVTFAGWLAERVGHGRALLALFVLRGVLLAALTLNALAPWIALAAPAFALIDFLTLPTLMRAGRAARTSGAGCPGLAHHAGMVAGAALATTSWGFGAGFYALFLLGGALNLACAFALAMPRATTARTLYSASPALAAGGALDLR